MSIGPQEALAHHSTNTPGLVKPKIGLYAVWNAPPLAGGRILGTMDDLPLRGTDLFPLLREIWSFAVKKDIHPKYYDCKITYRGEHVMTVGATVPEMTVEIWSGSHPFFTGKQSFVDTTGRVEKFQKKFAGGYFKDKKK